MSMFVPMRCSHRRIPTFVSTPGRALSAAAFLLAFATIAGATTRSVPGTYATIEDAVAAAAPGDTILVSAGIYTPEVALTQDLTLLAPDGSAVTILDGEGTHRIFTDVTGEARIQGFMFTNGGLGTSTPEGGAIQTSVGSSLTVEDCQFLSNRAVKGGAISAHGDLTVRGTYFFDNSPGLTFPGLGSWGGAVVVWSDVDALFETSTFRANRSFLGGGIHALSGVTVRTCTFDENFANSKGAGLSVLTNTGSQPTLVEASGFHENSGGEGGGITVTTTGPKTIRSCEFLSNIGRQVGGGIAASSNGVLLIDDCSFYGNSGTDQGGGAIYAYVVDEGITIQRCYFRSNRCDDRFDIDAGGGALWVAQNGGEQGASIEDCTFVENAAVRGSAVLVEPASPGAEHPTFTRCVFAYNEAESSSNGVIACGFPGAPAGASIACSLVTGNTPNNVVCAADDGDLYILEGHVSLFCNEEYETICEDSVAWTAACGPMGGLSGCAACQVPIETSSWGKLKSLYR